MNDTGDSSGSATKRIDPSREACDAIRRLLARGAPWDACDEFRSARASCPADAELLYWGALAHARAGAPATAHDLLDQVEAAGARPDTDLLERVLSLRGRLSKDRLAHCGNAVQFARLAREAFAAYHAAYLIRRDPFPGINAASLAWLSGEHGRARTLAAEVAARLAAAPPPHDLWHYATQGEAALLRGDAAAARSAYEAAARSAGDDIGSTARMRAQLRLLRSSLPFADELLALVPAPTVLAFAGHMVDAPGRAVPRFPAEAAPAVGAALRAWLEGAQRTIAYTSAACGADILLIEAAQAGGAEVNVVLPFDRQDFIRTSVAVGGAGWVPRFEQVLARAHRVIMATDEAYLGDDVLFDHGARLVEGLAIERATQLAADATLLAVLGGNTGSAAPAGGTRASVRRWQATWGEPVVIDLDAIVRGLRGAPRHGSALRPSVPGMAGAPAAAARSFAAGDGIATAPVEAQAGTASAPAVPGDPGAAPPGHHRAIRTILFADVRGFGRLRDTHAPLFHARFFDAVAACIAASPSPPIHANTWGDALYAVFDRARDGAGFACQLLERIRAVDWQAAGLGTRGQIRISLHAGPVFKGHDPVTHRDSHFGSTVTQAARIEPVTQPDTIYASEVFAATLAAEDPDHGFVLEYLGIQPLAKDHGEMRLYRIDRAG